MSPRRALKVRFTDVRRQTTVARKTKRGEKVELEAIAAEVVTEAEGAKEEGTSPPAGAAVEAAVTVEEAEHPPVSLEDVETLRRELEEAKVQAAEYLDGWQRARAEFANYKKRIEQDQENARQLVNAMLLTKLLPVLDDFERAFQTLPPALAGMTWIEGIGLIYRKLQLILEQGGVKPIEVEGKTFDPMLHEAVTYEEVEGYTEGQIIGEVQRGYKLGDRVLRPALVRVAKRIEKEP
jgi:molecular chaperone GrpE